MSLIIINFVQASGLFSLIYTKVLWMFVFLFQGLRQSDITLHLRNISIIKTRNYPARSIGKGLEMLHSWQLMVKDQSILQFTEQPGWSRHLWPSTHIQGARKLWEKGSEKISIRILQWWVVGASGATELHSAISQPNAGTWKFEPITSYPWLGNRMNKKWRRWQFWQVPEQNGSRENNQKNASNVTFLHPLRLRVRQWLLS